MQTTLLGSLLDASNLLVVSSHTDERMTEFPLFGQQVPRPYLCSSKEKGSWIRSLDHPISAPRAQQRSHAVLLLHHDLRRQQVRAAHQLFGRSLQQQRQVLLHQKGPR